MGTIVGVGWAGWVGGGDVGPYGAEGLSICQGPYYSNGREGLGSSPRTAGVKGPTNTFYSPTPWRIDRAVVDTAGNLLSGGGGSESEMPKCWNIPSTEISRGWAL